MLSVLECFRQHRYDSAVIKHIYKGLKEDLFKGNRLRRPEKFGQLYLTDKFLEKKQHPGRLPFLSRILALVK